MIKTYSTLLFLVLLCFFSTAEEAHAWSKGIYLTQQTLEDQRKLMYLITQSKKHGINTFIIDVTRPSRRYENNIQFVKQHGIHYVARIVVFPDGGYRHQVLSKEYWEKKYQLAHYAIQLGADQIQLDYIRYRPTQPPSHQNAKDIHEVIKYFKAGVSEHNKPLQIATFGVANRGPSIYIGQNLKLFAPSIDILCPMTYPSHYEPFQFHARRPYDTVYESLMHLRKQFDYNLPFQVIPYIELYNYRYSLSSKEKLDYIHSQIRAIEDSNLHGWYAWNPYNRYDDLFTVLRTLPVK